MDTNYTEKAKRLMHKAARVTALVIVPLASAVNAHAIAIGPTLPLGSPTCSITDNVSSSSCSGGAFAIFGIPTDTVGVGLATQSSALFSSGGTAQLILSASGLLVGGSIPSGTTIPLAYNFDLSFLDGSLRAAANSWNLDFQLLDGAGVIGDSGLLSGTVSDPSLSGGAFIGGVSSMVTNSTALSGDRLTEQVTLNVSWQPGDADTLLIDVPSPGSFDYAPTNIASVPEPGTMGLTGSVFALAGFFLVSRRKGWTLVRSGR